MKIKKKRSQKEYFLRLPLVIATQLQRNKVKQVEKKLLSFHNGKIKEYFPKKEDKLNNKY